MSCERRVLYRELPEPEGLWSRITQLVNEAVCWLECAKVIADAPHDEVALGGAIVDWPPLLFLPNGEMRLHMMKRLLDGIYMTAEGKPSVVRNYGKGPQARANRVMYALLMAEECKSEADELNPLTKPIKPSPEAVQ